MENQSIQTFALIRISVLSVGEKLPSVYWEGEGLNETVQSNLSYLSKQEGKQLKETELLIAELASFKDSLLEIAKFWKSNLNDVVLITAAPLWKHFRLKPWQKFLKDTWTKLEAGTYDWAQLAHSIWPDRVIPKCTSDLSLAIAHGHEKALWEEVENAKAKLIRQQKKDADEITEKLIQQNI